MVALKLKAKEALSALDIKAVVRELQSKIVGGFVVNVYSLDDAFLFKIRCRDGQTRLLMIYLPSWISLTNYDFEKPKMPPPFCMMLRKYLRRGVIENVAQIGFDRIVRVNILNRQERFTLFIELVREGNLILCDEEKRIIGAHREVEYKDRIVKRGECYKFPPNIISEVSTDSLIEVLEKVKKKKLINLVISALGSPEISYEVLARLNLDPEIEVSRVGLEDLRRIVEIINEMTQRLDKGSRPTIIFKDDEPFSVVPIEFAIYRGMRSEVFNSFCEAVDKFFHERFKESLAKSDLLKFSAEEKKLTSTIEKLKAKISELSREKEYVERIINLLRDKYELMEEVLHKIRETLTWAREEGLRIEDVEVKSVDLKSKMVTLNVCGHEVRLNSSKSLMANISQLYEELKEIKRKIEMSIKVLSEKEKELEELHRRRGELGGLIEKRIKVRREVRYWYEKFLWFKSTDGFLVVGGRDATQNEVLVKKHMNDHDVYLHADIVGASSVIIKVDGRELPLTTINEAAQLAAAYSKAWKAGFGSVDVYWVLGSQVSKTPPSGEYLPKGAFMIRGNRNYIRGVPLRLAVGLLIEENRILTFSGPPSAVSKYSQAYVIVTPSDLERTITAKRIAEFFNRVLNAKGFAGARVDPEEILRLLPQGGFRIEKFKEN